MQGRCSGRPQGEVAELQETVVAMAAGVEVVALAAGVEVVRRRTCKPQARFSLQKV